MGIAFGAFALVPLHEMWLKKPPPWDPSKLFAPPQAEGPMPESGVPRGTPLQ